MARPRLDENVSGVDAYHKKLRERSMVTESRRSPSSSRRGPGPRAGARGRGRERDG